MHEDKTSKKKSLARPTTWKEYYTRRKALTNAGSESDKSNPEVRKSDSLRESRRHPSNPRSRKPDSKRTPSPVIRLPSKDPSPGRPRTSVPRNQNVNCVLDHNRTGAKKTGKGEYKTHSALRPTSSETLRLNAAIASDRTYSDTKRTDTTLPHSRLDSKACDQRLLRESGGQRELDNSKRSASAFDYRPTDKTLTTRQRPTTVAFDYRTTAVNLRPINLGQTYVLDSSYKRPADIERILRDIDRRNRQLEENFEQSVPAPRERAYNNRMVVSPSRTHRLKQKHTEVDGLYKFTYHSAPILENQQKPAEKLNYKLIDSYAITVPENSIDLPANMDFSGFRATGELSDTIVAVDGVEFKLHKFPLYIKSDFFRALARNPPKETIELTDFPGGADTFEMVANYCYNVKISITKANVCAVRCAAEFLQMNSRGNLADVADRFLQDTLTSARLGRHLGCIIDLVLESADLGAIAEQAGVVEKCLNALVDCWLFSNTVYIKRHQSDGNTTTLTDQEVFDRISDFPLEWFVQLVELARKKTVRPHVLAQLVQTYLNTAVKRTNGRDLLHECLQAQEEEAEALKQEARKRGEVEEEEAQQAEEKTDEAKEDAEAEDDKGSSSQTDEQKSSAEAEAAEAADAATPTSDTDTPSEEAVLSKDDTPSPDNTDGSPVDPDEAEEEEEEDPIERPKAPEPSEEEEPVDLKEVLDAVVPRLPETTLFAELLAPPQWSLSLLLLVETELEGKCECGPQLRRLVGNLLHRLSPQQLSTMPPNVLTDVVRDACREDGKEPSGQNSTVCGVIDSYLRELAERGELSVDTFTTMVQAVPRDYRLSHDTLFQVLEALLQSDKVKLTDEQKSALMDTVDFDRLSESTLQRAYESDLVPQAHITKAALSLCARLRTELDGARAVIRSQDQEMARYGLGPMAAGRVPSAPISSTYTRYQEPASQMSVVPAPKSRYQAPGITYTYPSGAMSSLSSDLELQLALDSIETRRRAELSDSYYGGSTYGGDGGSYYYDDPVDRESYRSKSYYRNNYDRYGYRY